METLAADGTVEHGLLGFCGRILLGLICSGFTAFVGLHIRFNEYKTDILPLNEETNVLSKRGSDDGWRAGDAAA